jgi:hypothetical protein
MTMPSRFADVVTRHPSFGRHPLPVTVIGWLYIATGAIGFVYHLGEFSIGQAFRYNALWIELVRLVAIVCGAFLLRGRNWARWVVLAWMGFHVIVGALHSVPQLAIHCLFLAAIAYFLFRSDAGRFFRGPATGSG